ncbi:MAG: 4Fe-4S dicluster domain-containing protein, partial [Thermoanaerobaculia bacterium]|nr:4Fe-4S dicluster domain-containing protein [Thermoanaerobaculia bacterium]
MSSEFKDSSDEGPKVWSTLGGRRQEPVTESEFKFGALDPPDGVTRRSVLKLLGASAALAGTAACRPVEHIVPYVEYPEGIIPGVPQRYATTMTRGADAYGIVVESHEGRPNKIEGNELHPASLGAASAQIQAAILELYDPDRAVGPRRVGEASSLDAFRTEWTALAGDLAASGGEGLAVLSAGHSSPTLTDLAGEFAARYPQARWVTWDAVSDRNILAAHAGHRPVYHLDRARVVLDLDCDLLHGEGNALVNARGWSRGRNDPTAGMNRLYSVESGLSVTGASADHRIPLQSRQVKAFLNAVARSVGVAAAGESVGLEPRHLERAQIIGADLRAAGSAALIAIGRRQPPTVHALALDILRTLGALGETVTYHPATDVAWGSDADLQGLVEAMTAGSISTLVILGGNPVYETPGSLDFAAALDTVATSIHLGGYYDETSLRCTWHLPQTHFLEAWGDARAVDGTPSIVQPLIAPLHGGVSPVEVIGFLASGTWSPGLEWVQRTWNSRFAVGTAGWNKVLHDGLLASGVLPAVDPAGASGDAPSGIQAEAAVVGEGYELVWLPSSTVWDGRYSNNAWLQEAPDPMSKLSWDNAALIDLETANELGVETEDAVTLSRDGLEVTLPVIVLPGQAKGSIAVDLGYGRSAAGRVGNGIGVDINPLRGLDDVGFVGGVSVVKAVATNDLVFSQEEWSLNDRPLVRQAAREEYLEHPAFAQEPDAELDFVELYPRHDYSEGPQWGMAIDLNACTGCMACVTACQSENNIPVVGKREIDRGREMFWLRVDRYFQGDPNEPEVLFQPVPCMHCENAPCEQVCPVAATVHNPDGLNLMVYNRCIGTRYCSNNCPYKVRRFNFYNFTRDTPELTKMAMNPDVTVRSRGVMEKCTYC